jgi:hypothetical protein
VVTTGILLALLHASGSRPVAQCGWQANDFCTAHERGCGGSNCHADVHVSQALRQQLAEHSSDRLSVITVTKGALIADRP